MSKRLYTEAGPLNAAGAKLAKELETFLDEFVNKADKQGFDMRDLETMVHRAIGFPTTLAMMQRQAKKAEKKGKRK